MLIEFLFISVNGIWMKWVWMKWIYLRYWRVYASNKKYCKYEYYRALWTLFRNNNNKGHKNLVKSSLLYLFSQETTTKIAELRNPLTCCNHHCSTLTFPFRKNLFTVFRASIKSVEKNNVTTGKWNHLNCWFIWWTESFEWQNIESKSMRCRISIAFGQHWHNAASPQM